MSASYVPRRNVVFAFPDGKRAIFVPNRTHVRLIFRPMALNGAEFVDFTKNQMFINPKVFDERVWQMRSSKTPAFIAIQFGAGLAHNAFNLAKLEPSGLDCCLF